MAKTLRMGGVGLGHIGERRARILHDLPNVELVARADLDPDRGAAAPAVTVPARWVRPI